ncbi:MAG: dethiobiotin synthase [Phycisphaeraceae bacterium]
MIDRLPALQTPGLFITGTDTGVGKTVAACAIAAALRQQQPRWRVGVCKPFSSGCRREREGLVHEDAEALAHFADCRLPLDVINPIRFTAPLAPAVAAEQQGKPVDWPALGRALNEVDRYSDAMLVEGVGGLLVPIDPDHPKVTVLDLIVALRLPVVVVTRAGLGTLNHTAMTVRLLHDAACDVAGLVINGYDPDDVGDDPAITTNRRWLTKMTGVPVLAVLPKADPRDVAPQHARLDAGVLEAAAMADWLALLRRGRH